MSRSSARAAALLALCLPLPALAGLGVDVSVYDRTAGHELPVYWHGGERHVAGEPGHEYVIRIRNRGGRRVLAVTSVDGVNVITGASATPAQSGYVIDPHGGVHIDGWRKSLGEVAAFYFTRVPESYAARTGRPDHVGVIGVALFRERVLRPQPLANRPYQSVPRSAAEPLDPPSLPDESAAEPAAQARDAQESAVAGRRERDDARLGTGHGQRLPSAATRVDFQRATDQPEVVIRIFYDSERNLVARGIIPKPRERWVRRSPDPFPGGFVPDP